MLSVRFTLLVLGACSFILTGCASSDGGAAGQEQPGGGSPMGSADGSAPEGATPWEGGGSSDASPAGDASGDAIAVDAADASSSGDGGNSPPTDCTVTSCRYVRSGANGSSDGSDWTNAYPSLPMTLQRGATYFVAAGTYGSYTFATAESGTSLITIKKATGADHGTSQGWVPAYGGGQAAFHSPLTFTTGYWVFDGQTRDENDWFNGDVYGFRIDNDNQDANLLISAGSNTPCENIDIRYVYISAIVGNLPSTTIGRTAVNTDTGGQGPTRLRNRGHVFSHMFINGSSNAWFVRGSLGPVIEYSASDNATGNSANHGEIVNLYYEIDNAVVRYCQFRNCYVGAGGVPAGGGTALIATAYSSGGTFYGNVFRNFQVGDAAIGFDGATSDNMSAYNNTFVDSTRGATGFKWGAGTGNREYNNLFVNFGGIGLEGTHDYNAFSGAASHGEAHEQLNLPTSVFANYSAGDVRLVSATAAGMTLSSPYNVDPSGVTRGADGTWDRGAYEYRAP